MHLGMWRKLRVTIVLALTFSAENADTMLLSAMYLAIGTSLGIGPSQLGNLSMFRSLVTAICVPFVGVIGNLYNRLILIAVGTVIWGAMSIGMGFAANYQEAAAWTAMNGLGLALVMPCAQSIMAEVFAAKERGRAFGTLFTLSAVGGMICNFLAISFSRERIGRLEGWRVMFFGISAFAGLATVAVLLGGIEPRKYRPKQEEEVRAPGGFWPAISGGLMLILRNTWQVFRIRSFQIILIASVIGTIAFTGIAGYRVMYFQLLGFSDVATATMSTVMVIGVAAGFLMGGAAGDWLFLRFPNASRPFINQLSMAVAGPLAIVLFKAMPGCSRYATGVPGSLNHLVPAYCALEFFIGALGCFPVSNNAALFAEIVPESIRTSVYAFDRCITGAIGAAFTPLTGILAERLFGFTRSSRPGAGAAAPPAAGGHAAAGAAAHYRQNVVNARALENGLVWVMLVPMVIKFFIYFALYYTLPHDRIEEVDAPDSAAALDEEAAGGTGKSPNGGKAKGPTNGFARMSPPIAGGEEEQEEAQPAPVASPFKAGRAGSVTALRRAPSTGREVLAAQVVQSAQARRNSVGLEAPHRATSLQRLGSGYARRSGSMDALNRYISLELAQPPALSPRRPVSKSNGE